MIFRRLVQNQNLFLLTNSILHCGQDLATGVFFEDLCNLRALLYNAEQECPQNLLGGKMGVLQFKHSSFCFSFFGLLVLLYFALQDLEQNIPGESSLFVKVVEQCKQVFNI